MSSVDLLVLLSPKNIIVFVLILTRISGLLACAPIFSSFPIPVHTKVGLSVFVAFLIFPAVISSNIVIPDNMLSMSVFLVKEFAIGALIGFLANLIFIACQIGAELLSIQAGLSFSSMLDPTTGSSTTSLSQLYIIPLSLVFLTTHAHDTLFMTLAYSFEAIKPGFDLFLTPNFVSQVVHMTADVFSIAIGLILPVFGILFVTEVLLGFVSKMMPKMNIFMLSLPLKIYLTFLLMLMFLEPTCRFFNNILQEQGNVIQQMFVGG